MKAILSCQSTSLYDGGGIRYRRHHHHHQRCRSDDNKRKHTQSVNTVASMNLAASDNIAIFAPFPHAHMANFNVPYSTRLSDTVARVYMNVML